MNEPFGTFDFETYGWEAEERVNPLCCTLQPSADKNTWKWIYNRDDPDYVEEAVLDFMLSSGIKIWWAHNASRFDDLFLSAAAMRLNYEQSANIVGGSRIVAMEFWNPNNPHNKIVVCDLYMVIQAKLRDIAIDFELPSKKMFRDDDYSFSMLDKPESYVREGCEIDGVLVREAIEKVAELAKEWGGGIKRTFSSIALNVVKSKLKDKGFSLPKHSKNPEFNYIGFNAYTGSRVEVYEHEPSYWLTEVDRASSFPAAMQEAMPWEPQTHLKGKAAQKAYDSGQECLCLARVSVPDMYIPVLPYRLNGIFFPTGEWEAWFAAPELRYAEKCGAKILIKEALTYTREYPFKEFVNQVYAVKETATGALRSFTKLILNGAYGRFAEKPDRSILRVFPSQEDAYNFALDNPGATTELGDSGRAVAYHYIKWAEHGHAGIASYITAHARIALREAMLRTEKLAYVDCDACHGAKYNGEISEKLGGWKLEVGRFKGEYFAPKMYRLTQVTGCKCKPKGACGGIHVASKGFPVSEETFAELIESRAVSTSGMRLFKTQLRGGGKDVRRREVIKRWAGHSRKRAVLEGGSTRPWSVRELLEGKHEKTLSPRMARKVAFDGSH